MANETKIPKAVYNTEIPKEWEVKPVGKAFKICNNLQNLPIISQYE